jgi:hypothetical protein
MEKLEDALAADPPSLILLDLPFDSSTLCLDLMARAAELAERMMAPLITSIDNRFFNLARWEDLQKLPYIPHYLDEAQFAKWRRLREKPGADWMCVGFNGFLVRHSYSHENKPGRVEFVEGKQLYLNPVWALAALMSRKWIKSGWPTGVSYNEGAKLDGLVVVGEDRERLSTAAYPSGDRPEQFTTSGITPLVGLPGEASVASPPAVTISGKGLDYQMIFSRIISLVLWCKDNFDLDAGPAETRINFMAGFAEYFTAAGQEPPADLNITVKETDTGRPYLVSISLTPGKDVLPSGEKVELALNW